MLVHRRVTASIKGTLSRASLQKFKISKRTLRQRKPTNTGPVLTKNYNTSVMKLKKSSIIVIPPGAQDPNLKKLACFFFCLFFFCLFFFFFFF